MKRYADLVSDTYTEFRGRRGTPRWCSTLNRTDTDGYRRIETDNGGYRWIQADRDGYWWIQTDTDGYRWIETDKVSENRRIVNGHRRIQSADTASGYRQRTGPRRGCTGAIQPDSPDRPAAVVGDSTGPARTHSRRVFRPQQQQWLPPVTALTNDRPV